jgi:hypothetical protein
VLDASGRGGTLARCEPELRNVQQHDLDTDLGELNREIYAPDAAPPATPVNAAPARGT